MTGFKAKFDNFNQSIVNEYSNYYLNTAPFSMEHKNIIFTLKNINFNNLAKLKLISIDPNHMGIAINAMVVYQVKFKDFETQNSIEVLVMVSNNLEDLTNIQEKIFDNFLYFIDTVMQNKIMNLLLSKIKVLVSYDFKIHFGQFLPKP